MKGICKSVGKTLVLEKGKVYYLFHHGKHNYYVSNFNEVTAHMGSFQKKLFEVLEQADEEQDNQKEKNEEDSQMDMLELLDE